MPTLTRKNIIDRQTLCRKYRIEFLGEINPSNWPECHQDTLGDISEVVTRSYNTYATNPAFSVTDPWKIGRKDRAMALVNKAKRNYGCNELTWRLVCEPFMISRLLSEVCCLDCRKRVWRSDIEVRRNDDSGPAIALRKRQAARQPCSCPRVRLLVDQLETLELNRIFNFQAHAGVRYDQQITEDLGRKEKEKPDGVYGLRKTRNIERLLHDIKKSAEEHEPGAHTGANPPREFQFLNQPMDAKGDEQLFPFLVLEAKPGFSDEWYAINMQTAFAIKTFLETQRQLYSAASARSEWKERPLLWYLSYKGENWRLCAAYTEDAPAEPDRVGTTVTRVIDVWHGCITTCDGALQLVLLVDYIFDWARDKYREDIIRALGIVAHGERNAVSEIYPDADIHSAIALSTSSSSLGPSQANQIDDNNASNISAEESSLALESHQVVGHNIITRPHELPNYDANSDWVRMVESYVPLQDPFQDISELSLASQDFIRYCRENSPYDLQWEERRHRKRKRPEESECQGDEEVSGGKRVDGNRSGEENSEERGSD